jgi:hypothetical protein
MDTDGGVTETQGVCGGGTPMLTFKVPDQVETTEVSVEQRAWAFTGYVFGEAQDLIALVVPTGSQLEFVPSPQSKRY